MLDATRARPVICQLTDGSPAGSQVALILCTVCLGWLLAKHQRLVLLSAGCQWHSCQAVPVVAQQVLLRSLLAGRKIVIGAYYA